MVCQACGNAVEGAFCSRCGARVQAAPVPPAYGAPPVYGAPPPVMYVPRVRQHVQTLGILWCVFGAYRALTGIFAGLFLMGMTHRGIFGGWGPWGGNEFPFQHAPWMAAIGSFVVVLSIFVAALSLLVGFALLNRKSWGRTLAIVMAVLSLIKIPVGTALGIYTLWVLAPAASGAEWDAIADRS